MTCKYLSISLAVPLFASGATASVPNLAAVGLSGPAADFFILPEPGRCALRIALKRSDHWVGKGNS